MPMKTTSDSPTVDNQDAVKRVSLLQVIGSILACFYGVQSSKNRKRDFQSGKAGTFIAVGVVMTAVWYLTIYLVVTLVLKVAK
ncbi:MAG: DUF2970 domain-containing protein [Halieaceae bacterium]|nr:DUF2970 domain-containing protein [Halieaceae bacterium]